MVRQRDHQRSLPWDQVPSSFEPRTALGLSSRAPNFLKFQLLHCGFEKRCKIARNGGVYLEYGMQISVVSVLDNWFISDLNSLSQLLSAPNHQAYIDTPCHVDVHKPILLHTWQVPNNIKWLGTTSLWIADQRFLEKLPLVSQSSRSASSSDLLKFLGMDWHED